mmetsp:Transcript_29513/g.66801  ORF Transcript_29513/g.66801 Transcript_29513/m.66801 type:complete len:376 (-) Transcript_29513:606-1733(-)
MAALTLEGFGSDDEDDDTLSSLPQTDAMATTFEKQDMNAFMLSQSGAFKTADFQIRPEGGLTLTPVGEAHSPDHARPAELTHHDSVVPELVVASIADLEMMEELGSGASGTVYKAKHVSTGTLVAVKCVTILEKTKRDQVVSELRIMKSHALGARWLVAMHNAFYEEAKVYTVLEMMDGGSLEDLVKRHAAAGGLRNEYDLAHIAREVLGGLNYLHRQLHQVHRDLKPANVMLNSAGAVKISDFGISSQLENTGAFAETFVGTTCYMSPERLAGERYSYGADVWALGLILLELATGKYPYPMPDSYFQLLAHIMDRPAPALPAGTFSADFAGFTSLCVDKVPKMRPSAHDLLKHPWLSQQQTGILDMSLEGLSLN